MCVLANNDTSTVAPVRKMNKRRLSFAPEISKVVGTVLSRDDITTQEKASYWYSHNDYAVINKGTRAVLLLTRKHRLELVEMVQESYKAVHDIVDQVVDDDEFESLLIDPSHYTSVLEKWCLNSYDRRGLEKSMGKYVKSQRSADARKARGMVFQTGAKRLSRFEIAQAYAIESRHSCVYARMIAHADYQTVHCMEHGCPKSTNYDFMNTAEQETRGVIIRACMFRHQGRLATV
jgi:hypothetical protein